MVKGADPEAVKILAQFDVFEPAEYNKIKCTLTGHELPNRGKTLKEYTDTKKFQTAWKIHKIMKDNPNVFEELDERFLGCKITKKVLARDPKDLERHLGGKRLKRAIAKGITGDEPEKEEDEVEEEDAEESVADEEEMDEDEEEMEDESEGEEEEMEVDPAPHVKKDRKNGAPAKAVNKGSNTKAGDKDGYDFGAVAKELPKPQKRKTEGKGVDAMKKKKRGA